MLINPDCARHLLVVGAIPDEKNRLQYGGATVATKLLLDFLNEQKVDYTFVQTNRYSDVKRKCNNKVRSTLAFFTDFSRNIWDARIVMFNFSDHGVVSLFPPLSRIVRGLGKKVVLRKFGGSFDQYLNNISQSKKHKVISAIEKCDLILFETKAGIEHLKSIADVEGKVEWLPNVRKHPIARKNPNDMGHRLIFLSHICDEKGVADILELAKYITPEYKIDLFGAIKEQKYADFNWRAYNVMYHGEISSQQVLDELHNSTFLLLPSYREGYPGIIIEAMSVGLPVITTTAGGIPEIITDGKEGIMVSPGDVSAICDRLKHITPKDYSSMSKNALHTFEERFEAESVNARILKRIINL